MSERRVCKPHFISSDVRGSILACECGWEFKLPNVLMSPIYNSPADSFFRAGFDVGREYERHFLERVSAAVERQEAR